jgi:hypothetical protein
MIEAKVIADSISPQGDRLTTFILTFPRIILSEFNTHRMFSRNSASSRAIPFEKMVKSVEENPFIPIAWQKDHKGMQGSEYFTDNQDIQRLEDLWILQSREAIKSAQSLNNLQTTKQLCNRLLEPFMWHTVIITSGKEGLENFFDLRCPQYDASLHSVFQHNDNLSRLYRSKKDMMKHFESSSNRSNLKWLEINKGQSEIHIMALAENMWDVYNESIPKQLQAGEWQ